MTLCHPSLLSIPCRRECCWLVERMGQINTRLVERCTAFVFKPQTFTILAVIRATGKVLV